MQSSNNTILVQVSRPMVQNKNHISDLASILAAERKLLVMGGLR